MSEAEVASGGNESCRMPLPSALATNIAFLKFAMLLTNAICAPLGDHTGSEPDDTTSVSPEPSRFATSNFPERPEIILPPIGDQPGFRSPLPQPGTDESVLSATFITSSEPPPTPQYARMRSPVGDQLNSAR